MAPRKPLMLSGLLMYSPAEIWKHHRSYLTISESSRHTGPWDPSMACMSWIIWIWQRNFLSMGPTRNGAVEDAQPIVIHGGWYCDAQPVICRRSSCPQLPIPSFPRLMYRPLALGAGYVWSPDHLNIGKRQFWEDHLWIKRHKWQDPGTMEPQLYVQ